MCNLYSQHKPREELRGLFKVSHNGAVEVEPQSSIFPGYMAPVVMITTGRPYRSL
jgi:hypothetical protein